MRFFAFAAFVVLACLGGEAVARDAAFMPPEMPLVKKEEPKKEETKKEPAAKILPAAAEPAKEPPKEIKPINFGTALVGEKIIRATMLVNDSAEPIVIRSIEMIEADNGLQRLSQGCVIGKPIPQGTSCPVILQWEPKKAGTLSTDLVIHHSGKVGFTVIAVRGEAKEKAVPPAPAAPAVSQAPAQKEAVPAPAPAATPAPAQLEITAPAAAPAVAPPSEPLKEIAVPAQQPSAPVAQPEAKKEPIPAPAPQPEAKKPVAAPAPALPRKLEFHKKEEPKTKKTVVEPGIDGVLLIGTVGDRAIFRMPEGDTAVIPVGGTLQTKAGGAKLVAVAPYAAEFVVKGQERTVLLKGADVSADPPKPAKQKNAARPHKRKTKGR